MNMDTDPTVVALRDVACAVLDGLNLAGFAQLEEGAVDAVRVDLARRLELIPPTTFALEYLLIVMVQEMVRRMVAKVCDDPTHRHSIGNVDLMTESGDVPENYDTAQKLLRSEDLPQLHTAAHGLVRRTGDEQVTAVLAALMHLYALTMEQADGVSLMFEGHHDVDNPSPIG